MNWRRTITLKLTATEAVQLHATLSALDNEEAQAIIDLLESIILKLNAALRDKSKRKD